jgi:hypothetical protein
MRTSNKSTNKHAAKADSPRAARKQAGKSQIQAAVAAGVSEPLVRLYEANRDAVTDAQKRVNLDRIYAGYIAAQECEER